MPVSRKQPPRAIAALVPMLLLAITGCQLCAPRATPRMAPANLGEHLPDKFQAVHAVVFEVKPHWWWPTVHLAAIGYSTVDRAARVYRVVCLSPLGVKLFEVFNTNGVARVNTLLSVSGDQQQRVRVMGDDVASLFFDLVPPTGAPGTVCGERWLFSQPTEYGRTDYTLAVADGLPRRKEMYEGRTRLRIVTFDNYVTMAGCAVPHAMELRDSRRAFRLIFVLKEFKNLVSNGTVQELP